MPRWRHRLNLALAGIIVLCFIWQASYFVRVLYWKFVNPEQTHFMALRLEVLQDRSPNTPVQLRQQWLPYTQISPHLRRAVVAAEDDKFIDHEGFDWEAMQQALAKNQRRGKAAAGGSTISQQLAKNLFLSPERSLLRKAQEALITVWIELLWDKSRILEVYLNVAEWGEGIFGAEAAARRYFNISASRLNPEQAAHLAVMLPAPRRHEKRFNSPYLTTRTQIILTRMRATEIP